MSVHLWRSYQPFSLQFTEVLVVHARALCVGWLAGDPGGRRLGSAGRPFEVRIR
jgi:hypothetical protein